MGSFSPNLQFIPNPIFFLQISFILMVILIYTLPELPYFFCVISVLHCSILIYSWNEKRGMGLGEPRNATRGTGPGKPGEPGELRNKTRGTREWDLGNGTRGTGK